MSTTASPKEIDGGLKPGAKNVFIGIDQSYSGFGLTLMDARGEYRTWVYKAPGTGSARLYHIRKFLTDTLAPYTFSDAAMEGYAYGAQMAHMAGELGGMVKLVLADLGLAPLIIPPSTLKKYVTGKGVGIQKSQMLLAIYKKYGVEFQDDNAADSYALARMAGKYSQTALESEIIVQINGPKYRETLP
jgi:Holliday junction resolvasome RuvABC endonuclease subunit